jgi:hypothetical protein
MRNLIIILMMFITSTTFSQERFERFKVLVSQTEFGESIRDRFVREKRTPRDKTSVRYISPYYDRVGSRYRTYIPYRVVSNNRCYSTCYYNINYRYTYWRY